MTWNARSIFRLLAGTVCCGLLVGCQTAPRRSADCVCTSSSSQTDESVSAVEQSASRTGRQTSPDAGADRNASPSIRPVSHAKPAPMSAIETSDSSMTQDDGVQKWPIDLPTALRLANASNLDVALARERINASYARLEGAEALWLPNLSAGPSYLFHEGTIQRVTGEIIDVRRSSLFVGGGPTLAVDVADAVFEPLVARQLLCADSFAADAAQHDTLLKVAEVYLDLLSAYAQQAIAEETFKNANELVRLTDEFVKQEVGLKSDAARALTERGTREQQLQAVQERIILASAAMSQLLRLDAQLQLTPVEKQVVPLEFVDEKLRSPDLVAQALQSRPELGEQRHLVQASVERLKQAQYGPLIPSVLLGYQSGGFGGGVGAHFGDFRDRNDLTAAAMWDLRNLGFGDRANRRVRESMLRQAQLHWMRVADRVAVEVVSAHRLVQTRRQQLTISERNVEAAKRSFDLNMTRIRGGAGLPIEVLQSLQALDRARQDYLGTVIAFSQAQFRLLNAIGNVPPEVDTSAAEGDVEADRNSPG